VRARHSFARRAPLIQGGGYEHGLRALGLHLMTGDMDPDGCHAGVRILPRGKSGRFFAKRRTRGYQV